ncbi:DUF6544 family protein [Marivita hallyeonensis]|uniref:Uncharacterized protein n=1 Tax=Marivita hallyeonensis TaxID=996342 RepID=A0A1M5XKY2_9RHOB|nr:DUF6544 family protein [Marivita hallyeonensis]SHI00399.1 hypothetical protein SAMN05443551_3992 [Marivita hallyeonensis]
MLLKTLVILVGLVLCIALVAGIGLYRAHGQNAAIIDTRVLADEPITIDLRPEVYADLPAPVRRYFAYAFNGEISVTLRGVEWSQDGDFKLPVVGQFVADGRQVSHPNRPAYACTGWFWRYGLPLIESRDAFFVDTHDMRAKLLGWMTVMHTDYQSAEQIDSLHSYLVLRYYGQAPLMPWALLPNDFVVWEENDETSAYLRITHRDLEGAYLVTFGPDGEIVSMNGDRLLMEGNETMQREVGGKSQYREIGGFMLPTRLEYRWYDQSGALISRFQSEISDLRVIR